MDEQTFRRLAPDAVAGRLDSATYENWKTAAAEDPARADFVVRVAEADARLSTRRAPEPPPPRPRKVPRRTFLSLGALIGMLGLLAGALVMHSYLKSRAQIPPANQAVAGLPDNSPAQRPEPASGHSAANSPVDTPPVNRPVEPEPLPQPQPQPELPQIQGLRLVSARDRVSVRAEGQTAWRRLQAGDAVPAGATVNVAAGARFRDDGLELHARGELQFELARGQIRFITGRAAARVSSPHSFSSHKQAWTMQHGAFIVEPRRLGGDLYLLEGGASDGAWAFEAPCRVPLDGTRARAELTTQQAGELELELIGPHGKLLSWDCESEDTRPTLGEVVSPGANGTGYAVRRVIGQAGIGVSPSSEVFTAQAGARLRLRVKTTAAALRVEFRVQLDNGYRVVDAKVNLRGNDNWHTVDVPLEILRAGRFRSDPGWLEGRRYSAFLIAPAVDAAAPLARHELVIDDLLVYVPES